MTSPDPRLGTSALAGLYIFAFSLVFWPLADLTMNVWPLQPGNVQWRYGAVGLLSAFLHTPMLGVLLAMAVAYVGGHSRTLRVLGFLQLAVALLIVLLVAGFAMDLLQVRGSRPPDSLPSMMVGGATAGAKYLVAAMALALMGVGAVRTASRRKRSAPRSPGTVVTGSRSRPEPS